MPVPNGTLTFNEVCEEACRNTSIEPSIMKAAVAEYMKTVQANVQKGFRVPVGEQFITVYPNLNVSVKDTKDAKTGEVTVATAKMVTANKGKRRRNKEQVIGPVASFVEEPLLQRMLATNNQIRQKSQVYLANFVKRSAKFRFSRRLFVILQP
ncbi:MAG: hypothetical protein IJV36_04440 [Prevotella sp.]|nr:hypothetical protein [Prevotella sp.]